VVRLLASRELARRTRCEPPVVISSVNPGLYHSDLARNVKDEAAKALDDRKARFALASEEGSRALLHAVTVGSEFHGQ
jgi:hypothetical protein